MNAPKVVAHLESCLGPVDAGWRHAEAGYPLPFDVALFRSGPLEDSATFSTVGLSNQELRSERSGKVIRHELVVVTRQGFGVRNIPALMQQLGMEAIREGRAYLRGEVVGPRDAIFEGTQMAAFYVSAPSCFPSSFARVATSEGVVVFAWFIPITRPEAEYVLREGWEQFEDVLANAEVDLTDFDRNSIV